MLELKDKKQGICYIIHKAFVLGVITAYEASKLTSEMHSFLKAKGWHSGAPYFPIAHLKMSAHTAYNNYNKWNENTEYGRRRRATLKHLNKYLEELRS